MDSLSIKIGNDNMYEVDEFNLLGCIITKD